MKLTDAKLRSLRPRSQPYKATDGGGLFILVKPNGSKLWRYSYRFEGKQKTLAIGIYGVVSLAEAREMRNEAWKLLKKGIDPAEEKQRREREARQAKENTFHAVGLSYLARLTRMGRSEATVGKNEWLLRHAKPLWARPITEIGAREILGVLLKVEAAGRHDTACTLRGFIGAIFRHAISEGMVEGDPTFALRNALKAPEVKNQAAIIDPVGFSALLRAVFGFHGQPATMAALKLAAYLFPRPGELRQAEWREFDLDRAIWTVPAIRAKMRREHKVPLPPQAIAVLRQLKIITGDGRLAFPGLRTTDRPISENTLNAALRRLGYSKEQATAHGFRASASTLLNESGKWNPDAIERQLAHIEKKQVRGIYSRGEFWNDRVRMIAWWANYIDVLRDAPPTAREEDLLPSRFNGTSFDPIPAEAEIVTVPIEVWGRRAGA